jgi:hypothetical protein
VGVGPKVHYCHIGYAVAAIYKTQLSHTLQSNETKQNQTVAHLLDYKQTHTLYL